MGGGGGGAMHVREGTATLATMYDTIFAARSAPLPAAKQGGGLHAAEAKGLRIGGRTGGGRYIYIFQTYTCKLYCGAHLWAGSVVEVHRHGVVELGLARA